MMTTKDFGALAGVAEPEAAVDPNAPVELPRRCGTCAHFARFALTGAPHEAPRVVRFGGCDRGSAANQVLRLVDEADATCGPAVVGDLFGCVFFVARLA